MDCFRINVHGCDVTIQTASAVARAGLTRIYGQFLINGVPSPSFTVDEHEGAWRVCEGTTTLISGARLADAILTLEGAICNRIIECRSDLLGIHGAVLVTPAGGLLVTGASGAGKSTLSMALTSLNWPLCTDDASFLDNVTGHLLPIPRCFHLDSGSCHLLAGFGMTRFANFDGSEILTPSDLFPGNPASISIRRIIYLKPEGSAGMKQISQAAMMALLCSESGRGRRAWEDVLPELVQFVSSAESWTMSRGELSSMVASVHALCDV